MNPPNPLWEVARWEFRRYVKLRQQIVGAVVFLVMLLGGAALGRMGNSPSEVEVAVVGADALPALPSEVDRFRFTRFPAGEEAGLRQAVDAGDQPALLVLTPGGGGTLVTRQEPGWQDALEAILTSVLQIERMGEAGLDPGTLAALQTPFALVVEETAPRAGRGERVAAFGALGLSLLGILSGIGYIFSSVTGEKQNRLSEQVISAIHPQTWIDGKILGLSGVAVVAVLNALVSGALFMVAGHFLWGWSLTLPGGIGNPGILALAILPMLLGFLFWFALLTAIAAIMDDPHTSMRTQFMFLPMLPLIPAFSAISDPEATWVRILGLLPPTSSAVLPVRMVTGEVPWWEVGLAVVLLVAAVWAMSRVAGRVFRTGMLMYGKEPTWGEVRRWIGEA